MPTPQGLVSAHQPLFNVVQGGLATGGTIGALTGAVAGAATAGGLVGGVPFSPYHHHQALAAAASATQQPGGGGGAGGVASQPLAGTPGMYVCVHLRERERERERENVIIFFPIYSCPKQTAVSTPGGKIRHLPSSACLNCSAQVCPCHHHYSFPLLTSVLIAALILSTAGKATVHRRIIIVVIYVCIVMELHPL